MKRLSDTNKKYFIRITIGILIIAGIKFTLEWIINYQINQRVNIEIAKIDPTLNFRSKYFSLPVFRPGAVVEGITLFRNNRLALEIESTNVSLGSWSELVSLIYTSNIRLSKISVLIDGLAVYFENLDDNAKVIGRSLGLFNLHGSFALKANVDSKKGFLHLDLLKIDIKELFNLNLGLQVQGIDFKSNDKITEAMEVTGFRADYFDQSIMGRAMNLETFPEFVQLKNLMAGKEDKNQQGPDYSKRVTLSDETNKRITKLFMEYLLKPNTLTILQDPNKSIKVKNFIDIYLERPKDLSEILNQLGLKILIESKVYL